MCTGRKDSQTKRGFFANLSSDEDEAIDSELSKIKYFLCLDISFEQERFYCKTVHEFGAI